MTHQTPSRLGAATFNALATAGDALASAARRASSKWEPHSSTHDACDELRSELELLAHHREVALNTILAQFDAVSRGMEPPPPPEATGDDVADAAVAKVTVLVDKMRDREAGLVSPVVSLAQRWQTAAHEMEHVAHQILRRRSDDADTLQDYYRISHAAAKQARASQSLTVLAGRYPGRQWPQPQSLAKVVQHASARIIDYARVEVTGDPNVAVINTLAEQLIHLLAELLDNATRYSPPKAPVTVTFDKVDAGWAITVHDDGSGLDPERLTWAQDRVSGRVPADLHNLGEPPQTGLAVVGELARRHEFLVRLDGTANGGVRAMTTVPHHMLVPVAADVDAPVTPAPRQPAPAEPPATANSGRHRGGLETRLAPPAPAGGQTPSGLPIRVPQPQTQPPRPSTSAPPPAPAPDPTAEGRFMADFVHGSLEPTPDTAGAAPVPTDREEAR